MSAARQPPADLEVREVPVDDPDVAALMEVRNAVRVDDQSSEATWNQLGRQVAWAYDVVARRGGMPVGMASVAPLIYRPDSDAGWAELCVVHRHRRQGIGSELLRRISRAAEAHQKTELRFPVREDDAYTRGFLARRGYSVVSRDQDSELLLAESHVLAVDEPAGIRITTLAREPELAPLVYGVALEVEPDVPAEEASVLPPYEEWKAFALERDTTPPEAQFVAVGDDGRVLGYAFVGLSDVEEGIGWHGMTGTARAARGRGVATAVKRAVILWARDEVGLRVLRTTNEERNAPMLAINRKLGYRPKPATLIVRGPTASA